jgi:hypothetical protein
MVNEKDPRKRSAHPQIPIAKATVIHHGGARQPGAHKAANCGPLLRAVVAHPTDSFEGRVTNGSENGYIAYLMPLQLPAQRCPIAEYRLRGGREKMRQHEREAGVRS